MYFWRDNNAEGLPWHGPIPIATDVGKIDAISMIQSSFRSYTEWTLPILRGPDKNSVSRYW